MAETGMTYFGYLQFVAFALNLFVWTYVFAQRKRDPVNRAYLLFAGAITAWVFLDMLMSWPMSEATAYRVMKIKSIAYLPVGVLFLHFVNTLVGTSRFDRRALRVFTATWLIGQSVVLLTSYHEATVVTTWWGWTETAGPLFMPITIGVMILPLVYGLTKAVRVALSKDTTPYDRHVIRWVIQGTAIVFVIGLATDIVLPAVAGTLTEIPDLAALSTSIVSIHVFVSVLKHNLMATGVEQVAGLMFDQSSDATFAVDNRGTVSVMNDAARDLFGRSAPVSASDLIAGYGTYADNEAHEMRLRIGDNMRILSMTKTSNVRDGALLGTTAIVRDITQNRQAEDALRESEQLYRTLIDSAPDPIFMMNRSGVVLSANKGTSSLLQLPQGGVVGNRVTDLWPGECAERIMERAADVFELGEVATCEGPLSTESGQRWFRTILAPARDSAGSVYGVVCISHDLTERMKAERAVREERDFSTAVFETAEAFILVLDDEGRIVRLNPYAEALTGYTSAEVEGKDWFSTFLPERDRERARSLFGEALHDVHTQGNVNPIVTRGGEERQVEWYDRTLKDTEGKITGLLTIGQDVTMRIRAQQLQEASARNWQTTFDAIGSGIMLIDRTHRVMQCNAAAASLLGRDTSHVVNSRCYETVHGTVGPMEACPVERAFASCVRESTGVQIGTRSIEIIADPVFDETGEVTGAVHVMNDITERKVLEEERIRARDTAEAASKLKSQFLANVSHEIRTPLNGIIGMTELALETQVTDEQREYLEIVRGSGNALLTVINDILDFSKIEAGKMSVRSAEFDVRKTFEDAFRPLAMKAANKGVEAMLHVSASVPARLVGDAGRLRQVLVNLAGNAVKFTETGQVVVRIAAQADGARGAILRMVVRDTGPGIPEHRQKDLFNPFVQLDGSSTRTHGGTGLGLAICAQLAQLMGGRVWVKSAVGEGSSFHFTARCRIAEHVAPVLPSGTDQLVRLRVLLVDRNETSRRFMTTLLARWGMSTDCAADGDAAFALLREKHAQGVVYQFALVDCGAATTEELGFVERVRGDAELGNTRIIALSSSLSEDTRLRFTDLAVSAVVSKPVREADLMKSIQATLEMVAPEPVRRDASDLPSAIDVVDSLRVLVAEDNAVNQKVVGRMLERQGHVVVFVANGAQAVDAIAGSAFDLVLMDMQMPVLDGFEVTDRVRSGEKGSDRHLPIIAMTAHAMKGDRERCLAAGMDGYVAKPLRLAELNAEIVSVLARGTERTTPGDDEPLEPGSVFDASDLADRCDGDDELVREVVQLFLESSAAQLASIARAADSGDCDSLEREAHSLKGAARSTGARRVAEAASAVEKIGRGGDLGGAHEAISVLRRELRALRPEINALLMAQSK
jgi:two-component system sensor histidine kinase/response regulator